MGHSDFQAGFSRAEDTAYLWVPLLFTAVLMTFIIVGLAASS